MADSSGPLERCKLLTRWAFEYFDQTTKLLIYGLFQKGRVLAQDGVDEPVPGYPKRPVPRDEDAAKALKKRTLTNLYNARPQWLVDAHDALDAAVAAAAATLALGLHQSANGIAPY